MAEFGRKKFTQTEYRGAKYRKSQDKASQYLDTSLEPLTVSDKSKRSIKEKIHDEVDRFLTKLVPDECRESVVKGACLKKIFKLLGL